MDLRPWKPHGRALRDYAAGDASATVVVHDDRGGREEFPVSVWFRGPGELWALERAALALCRGRVLDVGAGTGVHALALQGRGLEVVAIDALPEAVEVMRRRGVRDARRGELFGLLAGAGGAGRFDTVLLLTNGAGLLETLDGLDRFLEDAAHLLEPGGQVLLDSTDVRPEDGPPAREDGRYPGELQFQLEYRGRKAPPFRQLYVDPDTLGARAAAAGWRCEIVARDDGGSYLARLAPLSRPAPRRVAGARRRTRRRGSACAPGPTPSRRPPACRRRGSRRA